MLPNSISILSISQPRVSLVSRIAFSCWVVGAIGFYFPLGGLAQESGWRDSTGKKKIEADFVRLDGVTLVLRKADGQEIKIPLSKLDDESRLRARAMAKEPPQERSASIGSTTPEETSTKSAPATDKSAPVMEWSSEKPVDFTSLSAQQFVDTIQRELGKKNLLVVWDSLPEKKQQQVQSLVRSAASKIEQRTFDSIKKFRNEVIGILRSKKQFVLNSNALPLDADSRQLLAKTYDPIVVLFGAYLSDDLLNVSTLQKKPIRDVLRGYINNITSQAEEIDKLMPNGSPFKSGVPDFGLKLEKSTSTEAFVSAALPQNPKDRNEQRFVFADGRWQMDSMVGSWDAVMAQAEAAIPNMDPKAIHQAVGQGIFFATAALGAISSTETQEDFDNAITQIMSQIPMPGGGMGPMGMAN
jgi:hypothetical protein